MSVEDQDCYRLGTVDWCGGERGDSLLTHCDLTGMIVFRLGSAWLHDYRPAVGRNQAEHRGSHPRPLGNVAAICDPIPEPPSLADEIEITTAA